MHTLRGASNVDRELYEAKKSRKAEVSLRGAELEKLPLSLLLPPFTKTLQKLDLSHNNLLEIPASLCKLHYLKVLSIGWNKLTDLPPELGCLASLEVLDAAHNGLHYIPKCLSTLLQLQTINFSGNKICEIDKQLLQLPKLQKLHLTKNYITNVPKDVILSGLPKLRQYFHIEIKPSVVSVSDDCDTSFLNDLQNLRLTNQTSSHVINAPLPPRSKLVTSDYGSCSLDLTSDSLSEEPETGSCYGDYGSDSDADIDTESERSPRCHHDDCSDSDSEAEDYYEERVLRDRTKLIKYKNVSVVIPEYNKCGFLQDEFKIDILEDIFYTPDTDERAVHASQVLSIEPHGSRFYDTDPAIIHIPLGVLIDSDDQVICLCSDTCEGDPPNWQPMCNKDYKLNDKKNSVKLRTNHFSLFTVIAAKPYPEAKKHIDANLGGVLEVDEVEGVQVHFPKGALNSDINASIKVFYGDEPFGCDIAHGDKPLALATPVVRVGPHGCQFNNRASPVIIKLPIPDCHAIMRKLHAEPTSGLTIWQSQTGDVDDLQWEQMNVDYTIECDKNANYFVCIPIRHFSWYKALWDLLSSSVQEAKIGVSYFYPYVQFSMMCQAFMQENPGSSTFGLEVICYRSDKKMPEIGNYTCRVGGTIKPKMVRPGQLQIRLASNDFEADVLHGEDITLSKVELDFRGREFEKQFACRFKGASVDKGVFGKVFLERKIAAIFTPLLEFNLTKSGGEGEMILDSTDRWSLSALKELATMLDITKDDNWKLFAKHLGFTNHEIRHKLAYTSDAFAMILGAYQARGGTPEEFLQGLYEVSRKIRLNGGSTGENLDQIGFKQRFSDSDDSFSDGSMPGPSGLMSPPRKRGSHSGLDRSPPATPMGKRKRKNSAGSFTGSSEMSGIHNEQACRENKRDLEINALWHISGQVNQNWKSLGRTLNLPEEELASIEHSNKDLRECCYQMFLKWKDRCPQQCKVGFMYKILCDNGLKSVAQKHCAPD
ncbi:unnamed protein product [Owenia fusiformis]|uniref:Uncharacterized protein n=1 Tax=Owenia fusiformis TaxID=6347 RepID=A0A8J1U510_OWEFU|nr:unnamed protein product [Owenia fusiformis]